jgi:hypothetical protein
MTPDPRILEKIETGLPRLGIHDPAALAAADPSELARELDVPFDEIARVQERARSYILEALAREGIADMSDLATVADMEALAMRIEIPVSRLLEYRETARSVPAAPAPRALPDRVVLSEDSSLARLCIAGVMHERIPILTARGDEDETRLLARSGADVVVLKVRAITAPARLRGTTFAALPIYRLRAPGGVGPEEERVRVGEIKNKTAPEHGRSFLGRFLGRKDPRATP